MLHQKWNYFSFTQSHPGKVRTYNEDACLAMQKEGVWVVADGMGGHAAGDIASRMLVDIVEQNVAAIGAELLTLNDLFVALTEANHQIHHYGFHDLAKSTMGTTAVLLYIKDEEFHCLWVGDSRMYLYRDGQLIQQSKDHSQVMEMVDKGLLDEAEAETHPLANVITRAVGVDEVVSIDHISGSLQAGDQFLLCSDGLTKELSVREIAACFQAQSVNDVGQALMHSALVHGASDNVTCAVVKAVAPNHDAVQVSANYADATVPLFSQPRIRTRGE
ncbi:serine/threonine protein phosphatase [Photobacterium jeanii]|uniref:Serine/threonine protein phosphatase n=1 Tax=Photobacterium jeanii TaxID=858640 RepID=A0A178K153_9GAMM|nr:protein phosphatase 2C domain-containing protein [Photobacterium jeanii]OAN11059.1 serine/threonine protein phosphatase [Photobacterium jeanii]PST90573.1 serine/threonine-protein phosphatase [Photobacterium jeanii]